MNTNRIKPKLFLLCLMLLFISLAIAGVLQGPADISINHVFDILTSTISNYQNSEIQNWQNNIILDVRLPRVIIALFAGASLALCGLVMQGMFRNPLASPSVLGVSSGASLGAVIAIYSGLSLFTAWAIPLLAFIGAGITLSIVYRVASTRGQTSVATLLLSGVAMSALNVAAISLLLALSLSNWDVARMIIYWTMGGLDGRTWDHVLIILPIVISGFVLLLFYSKQLDLLLLGEQHALSVGVDVRKTRRNLLIISTAMVGASVSVVGGIGFIGLVVPHILRLILGPSHRYLLPACLLGGAVTLLGADLFLRTVFSEQAIPLGVVTAALGAPFFLFLLIRQRFTLN